MVNHPNRSKATRETVVRFAMGVIQRSKDWQEVQFEIANNERMNAWVDAECAGVRDEWHSVCQSVIREAEERVIDDDMMPADYA